ncbi:hypothetical protein [Marinomonas shanghaiensis]|uniref:hypothetical protein n=1 Tax=Marinomonas shanghaiensis TaxID=2202418 RepID=UPI000DBAAFF9|nr:hypothetical protein [Marinomonas shanghaiensis]
MINTLISAINNREEVSFTYSGLPRVAQPSAVGISTAGNEVLRCYQTQCGHITPGHEWDLCIVANIQDLQITGNVFQVNPPKYKAGDKGMSQIYAQL